MTGASADEADCPHPNTLKPMKRPNAWTRAALAASTFCLVAAPCMRAQAASQNAAADNEDQPIVLSPFTVEASSDQGYQAKETLAGTRVRTELKDLASSITVVTAKFLQDTGVKNNEDLLVYTPSTEVAGIRGNFTGVAGNPIFQENTVSTTTRVRGLDEADNTRDYFLTDIPWDGYNVGRVDLQRGPNSILFGTGSPAGIINTSLNDAAFKTTYHFENRVDTYGSLRDQIDLNQEIVKGVLAIRLSGLQDDEKYEQKPAYKNDRRWYGALRFDPKLFGEANRTSIKVKYEDGKIRSNNPRQLPPMDTITPWFQSSMVVGGVTEPGYNKLTINQFAVQGVYDNAGNLIGTTGGSALPPGLVTVADYNANGADYPKGSTLLPGAKGGPLANATYSLGSNQGRSYWPDIINYYEATPVSLNAPNSAQPSGTPIKTIAAQPNTGFAGYGYRAPGTLAGVNPNFLPMAIPLFSQYAFNIQNNGFVTPSYAGSAVPGGVYYADRALLDPSIFNFYKKLLDGPNKLEWQDWKAFNATLEQGFFNDRLAFQFVFDHQDYTQGTEGWLQGQQYAINIDVNQTYADGSPNPNVGRPYVATATSAPGQTSSTHTVRNAFRFTPTAELRASDFLGDTTMAKIIGNHVFTGLYERDTVVKNYVGWAEYATSAQYMYDNSPNANAANTLNSNRSFEWVAYLGPSLASASSAAGANLSSVDYVIAPPRNQTAWNFNSHWNKPTDPNDPNYVNPLAPYSYVNYQTGGVSTGQQADNPANYIGWSQQPVTWLSDKNPSDFADLVQSANRTRYRDTSKGITWQGYLFGKDLVATFGWRKDDVTNYQSVAPTDQNSGFTSLNYPDNLSSRTDVSGTSKTWGLVYHLPKVLTDKLPWDSGISLFYDRGQNFKADASRLSLAGTPIPNATGDTKEYGITISTLSDKLSLKITKFKTKVANATLADTSGNSIAGLGANGYVIADEAIWGYAWATTMQEYLAGRLPGGAGLSDYASADGFVTGSAAADNYNHKGGTAPNGRSYAGGDAVVNAWLNAPYPATFFSSYALSPPIDPTVGDKTGRLLDSYTAGAGDITNGVPAGGGSSFGNHQTTVDNLSSGTEVELYLRPTKNWDITVNYAKVSATHENIDPVSSAFIGAMTAWMNGPAGQVREWFNGSTTTVGSNWNSSIVAPYTVELDQLGHEAPEVSPWRLNLITNYSFDHGFLKGLNVGAAFREEAGRIIGYAYDPSYKNVNSDDPNYAAVSFVTLGGLNVDKPFRGEAEHHVDLWAGYTRKITRKINWRIQLNVRSVGESDHLVAARINPDGSVALARIVEGAGYQLTNSFDF
ncbi:MAG TPA: TonB-dependent receptor plug domain-containing protein [Opitutus sp.]|nr:TonB-dependent receptor plug domain-containing protein [Opitutus sp.]